MKLIIFMARALVMISCSACLADSVPRRALEPCIKLTYTPPAGGLDHEKKEGRPPGVEVPLNWVLIFQSDQVRG